MRLRRVLRVAAVLAAIAVALTGCGSSDADIAAFRARAQAVCRQATVPLARIGMPTTVGELLRDGPRRLRLRREALVRLRALPVPSVIEGRIPPYLDALDHALAVSEQALAAARRGDRAALGERIEQGIALDHRDSKMAHQLKLAACAPL